MDTPFIANIELNKTVIIENECILFDIYVSRPNNPYSFLNDSQVNVTLQIIDENNNTVIPETQIWSTIFENNPVFNEIINSTGLSNGKYTAKINISDLDGNLVEYSTIFNIVENYSISVSTDGNIFERNTPVNISGFVQFDNGTFVSNRTVNIEIFVNGVKRTFSTVTNETGYYKYEFIPFETEAGKYDLIVSTNVNGLVINSNTNFAINGIIFNIKQTNIEMLEGTSSTFQLKIINVGETVLNNISISINDTNLTDEVSVNLIGWSSSSLIGGEEKSITIQIDSSLNSPPQASIELIVNSQEGSNDNSNIIVYLSDGNPKININPEVIKLNINPVSSSIKTITLSNTGYGTLENAQIVPPTQDWIMVNRNLTLGNISPNTNLTFDVLIYPSENNTVGRYIDNITLLSNNYPDMKVFVDVSVISSLNGSSTFHVIDEWLKTNISSSKVTLISQDIEGLFYENISNVDGYASFQQVPTGRYSYIVNAEQYDTISGVVDIEPSSSPVETGTFSIQSYDTNDGGQFIEVLLNPTWFEYGFKVTPTTIEDTYDVALEFTLNTEVPIPFIQAIPDRFSYTLTPGMAITNQTINLYNLGLIPVKNVKISSNTDSGVKIDLLSDSLSEIKAKNKTQIPFDISLNSSTPHGIHIINYLNISGEFLYSKDGAEALVPLKELSIPVYVTVPTGNLKSIPHQFRAILEPGETCYSDFIVKNIGPYQINNIQLTENMGDEDIALSLPVNEIPILLPGEEIKIEYNISVSENSNWSKSIYNFINISGIENGTLKEMSTNFGILIKIPDRIAKLSGSRLYYTIEPGDRINPNPKVIIKNTVYTNSGGNIKNVPVEDIDITYRILSTDSKNIIVDEMIVNDIGGLHIDSLDPGEEKEILLVIYANNSAIRGKTSFIIIDYTGKYLDNNYEIKEVKGNSIIEVKIPEMGLTISGVST